MTSAYVECNSPTHLRWCIIIIHHNMCFYFRYVVIMVTRNWFRTHLNQAKLETNKLFNPARKRNVKALPYPLLLSPLFVHCYPLIWWPPYTLWFSGNNKTILKYAFHELHYAAVTHSRLVQDFFKLIMFTW